MEVPHELGGMRSRSLSERVTKELLTGGRDGSPFAPTHNVPFPRKLSRSPWFRRQSMAFCMVALDTPASLARVWMESSLPPAKVFFRFSTSSDTASNSRCPRPPTLPGIHSSPVGGVPLLNRRRVGVLEAQSSLQKVLRTRVSGFLAFTLSLSFSLSFSLGSVATAADRRSLC